MALRVSLVLIASCLASVEGMIPIFGTIQGRNKDCMANVHVL